MKQISFIMPIYNNKLDELNESINSIINQNIESYELILVNDGSTLEEIDKFCKSASNKNKNIKYLYQTNSGSAVARNNGLTHATGKYIIFVDSDDILNKNFYKNFQKYDFNELDVAIFDYSYCDKNNEALHHLTEEDVKNITKENLIENVLYGSDRFNDFMFGSIWAKCFSRNFLIENNIKFRDELRKAQDRMFMLEVYTKCSSFKYIPIYAYKYRLNNDSICHKINFKMIEYYQSLYNSIKKYCNEINLNQDILKFVEYGIVSELLLLTVYHLDYIASISEKKKKYKEICNIFNFKTSIKKLKYKDFKSIKRKIKLFLYKNNLFYILIILYHYDLKKKNTKIYNK